MLELAERAEQLRDLHEGRAARLARALERIEQSATRQTFVPTRVDVARLRKRLGRTQTQFARRFGFSVATLRHWEYGKRSPAGPALVLLNLIERNPRAALSALKLGADEAREGP